MKPNFLKFLRQQTLSLLLATSVIMLSTFGMYLGAEPAIAQATPPTSTVVVTLNVDTGISISSPGNTNMSTDLGVSSNSAVATSTFTVTTNDTLGYALTVAASTAPALKSTSDTVPDISATPATWAISSGATGFGFSVYGTDVNTTTFGTGSACQGATSTPSATLKYRGFSTSPVSIATRSSTTTPSGVNTTVCYAVGQNNTYVPSGAYTATLTATATSQ